MISLLDQMIASAKVVESHLPVPGFLLRQEVDVMTFANYFEEPTNRDKILKMEEAMLGMEGQHLDLPVKHHFAQGLYARELFIPKDTFLTGKIHKYEHINFVLRGDMSVLTEHGPQRVRGPGLFVSLPGTKRAGYAYEDTVWVTVHAVTGTDPKALEAELTANSFEEYESFMKRITAGD